jgi:TolA-binding protein
MKKTLREILDSFLKMVLAWVVLSTSIAYGQQDSSLVEYGTVLSDLDTKKLYETTVGVLESYFLYHPQGQQCADVQWTLAQYHLKRKQYDRAYVSLLKMVLLYPDSPLKSNAKKDAGNMISKNSQLSPIKNKLLSLFDSPPEDSAVADRYITMLNRLRDLLYSPLNDALIPECRLFLRLFPNHNKAPVLAEWMGDMYQNNKEDWLALASYLLVIHCYPDSDPVLQCKVKSGQLYAGTLKNYKLAAGLYEDLLQSKADSSIKAEAQWNLAKTTEEKLSNPSLAVKEYQNLITLFPFSSHIPEALMRKAKLQVSRLKQYEAGIASYQQVWEQFPEHSNSPQALAEAGDIYTAKLKDHENAVQTYLKLAEKYPASKLAPEKLYDAAELADKKLKDTERSLELYQAVMNKFPEDRAAKKAARKIKSLKK